MTYIPRRVREHMRLMADRNDPAGTAEREREAELRTQAYSETVDRFGEMTFENIGEWIDYLNKRTHELLFKERK